jgi:hypothetical protein
MKNFGVFSADGYLDAVFTVDSDSDEHEVGDLLENWIGWPAQPRTGMRLRKDGSTWVWADPRTLDQIRADKWTEIKAERAAREAGTFTAVGHVFSVDTVKLTGAALDAFFAKQAGETYAQAWVLADNTAAMLTADEMIEAARTCKAYVSGLWVTSQMLRGEIEAAQDAAAVSAIQWP